MTKGERKAEYSLVREALHQYSTYFVDWEELHNNPKYRIEFPSHLTQAEQALKRLEQENENEKL